MHNNTLVTNKMCKVHRKIQRHINNNYSFEVYT